MLEAHDAIHVLYGSNKVDFWMIFATLLTFGSSLVLGIAALRNGSKATRIAEDASKREEAHRERERKRHEDEARHAAAAAMARSFWALELAIRADRNFPGTAGADRAIDEADRKKIEAHTEIELLHPDEQPVELAHWFDASWLRMRKLNDNLVRRNKYRGEAVGSIRRWKNRIVVVSDFLDPKRDF